MVAVEIAVLELIQAALEALADVAFFARRRWLARHESMIWMILIAVLLILVMVLLWKGPSPLGRERCTPRPECTQVMDKVPFGGAVEKFANKRIAVGPGSGRASRRPG